MSSEFQTFAALVIVTLAATWLIARAIAKRKHPGCGDDCTALTPELKQLQARLAKRR